MLVVITGGPPESRRRRRRTTTFQSLGRATYALGMPLFVTTPDWSLQSHSTVQGWKYSGNLGRFERMSIRIATNNVVIYDAMYLQDLERFKPQYRRLYWQLIRSQIPFFNPILPSKDVVYGMLETADLGCGQLPTTRYKVQPEHVLEMLSDSDSLWLKPTLGSGGRNMMFVQRISDDRYQVVAERFFGQSLNDEVSRSGLNQLVRAARRRRSYMAQSHVPLVQTSDGRKVDFRVTVLRTGNEKWRSVAVTGRFGSQGSMLTNFHAGGQVTSFTELDEEKITRLQDIGVAREHLEQAQDSALRAARRLQTAFPTLGLLGVDVGYAQDGNLFVYDCNGRPGRDILTNSELETVMTSIARYSQFLLNRRQNMRERLQK